MSASFQPHIGQMFQYHRLPIVLLLIALGIGAVAWIWWPTHQLQIVLAADDRSIVEKGRAIYAEHCASCHGVDLEGQPNWRQRDTDGYLPAPRHDASGHTWHHSDKQLFDLTKYGLGAMLGDKHFKTRMPAYEGVLGDSEIIAVLSYIKSRWPKATQARHDKINAARRSD